MQKFIIATNNKNKLSELNRILQPLGFDAVTAGEVGVDLGDVEETGTTFAENAYIKAKSAYALTGGKYCVIADDSGLCVDSLDGRPGVFSARYAGEGASDAEKIQKLLFEMKNVSDDKRTAHFVCSICCIMDDEHIITADGICNGYISHAPDGDNGFGYDPVFTVDGVPFAKLTPEQKDKLSHRGNALRLLREKLIEYLEVN